MGWLLLSWLFFVVGWLASCLFVVHYSVLGGLLVGWLGLNLLVIHDN